MGATTEIKETNIGAGLIGKVCDECSKTITQKDALENGNWQVDFDTTNDVKVEDNKIKGYGYNLTIWIRNVYHDDCHEAEEYLKEQEEKKARKRKKHLIMKQVHIVKVPMVLFGWKKNTTGYMGSILSENK